MSKSGSIHPSSIVSSDAKIGDQVNIGPYSVIEEDVLIGDNCWIGNFVTLKKGTRLGNGCRVFHGVVIGEEPQDFKYSGEPTTVEIGENVTLREYVTIHCGTKMREKTVVGDNCYLMAYVHVGHDSIVGDNVMIANGAQLGGHVEVGDHTFIGGLVAVHQFVKIGKYVCVGGGFRVVQDVPPFILVAGEPLKFSGLNAVGLRRQNFNRSIRNTIKGTYQLLFDSNHNVSQAVEEINKAFPDSQEAKDIISFVENSNRGMV